MFGALGRGRVSSTTIDSDSGLGSLFVGTRPPRGRSLGNAVVSVTTAAKAIWPEVSTSPVRSARRHWTGQQSTILCLPYDGCLPHQCLDEVISKRESGALLVNLSWSTLRVAVRQ